MPQSASRSFYVLAGLFVLGFWASYATASAKTVNALVLDQMSKSHGKITVYATANAIRIVNRRMNYVVIAKAPQWQVFTMNDKRHTYFDCQYSRWKPPSIMGLDYSTGGAQWKKVGRETIAALSVDRCEVANDKKVKMANEEEIPRSGIYWVANVAEIPAKVTDLLALYCGVDCLHKLPVRFKGIPESFDETMFKHPQPVLFLDTVSSHHEQVDASLFDLPSGFQRVAQDADLRMSRQAPKLLDHMLEDLDTIYGRKRR